MVLTKDLALWGGLDPSLTAKNVLQLGAQGDSGLKAGCKEVFNNIKASGDTFYKYDNDDPTEEVSSSPQLRWDTLYARQ